MLALSGANRETLEKFSKLYFPEIDKEEERRRQELLEVFKKITENL